MRTASTWLIPAAPLLAALLLACGDSGDRPGTPPAETPAAAETPPTPTPPAPTPTPAAPAAEPAGDPVARGNQIYQQYCASCHGPEGNGDGPVSAGLDPKPAKHSDGAYMNALTDAHIEKVIKEGGASVGKSPLMAPWGATLSDAQVKDVMAFVRSLAQPPYPGS
jgi:mono/diheme cytochrome c family protein